MSRKVAAMGKWKVAEKKKLARLLAVYPLDAYENIASYLPRKSAEDVEEFMKKMLYSTYQVNTGQKKEETERRIRRAPLEIWLEAASSLVEKEQFDFSSCISKVMGFVASFEEFPEGDIEGHAQPDYRMIYRYLSHILDTGRRDDVEELGPLESAIVLDLLLSLMEALSDCDVIVQNNVMMMKYLLLNERDDKGHPIPELLQKASENDFSELMKWKEGFNGVVENVVEVNEVDTKPPMQGSSIPQKDDQVKSNTDGPPVETSVTDKGKFSSIGDGPVPEKFIACYTYEANYKTSNDGKRTNPHVHLNSGVFHNKPGRKLLCNTETITKVTEIVRVVPPKNAKIIKIKPRSKKTTIREDGKYFGINVTGALRNDQEVDTNERQVHDDLFKLQMSRKRKYDTLRKKKSTKKEVKKPRMYSLNPFCVPISLLDLDS